MEVLEEVLELVVQLEVLPGVLEEVEQVLVLLQAQPVLGQQIKVMTAEQALVPLEAVEVAQVQWHLRMVI